MRTWSKLDYRLESFTEKLLSLGLMQCQIEAVLHATDKLLVDLLELSERSIPTSSLETEGEENVETE